MQRLRFVGPEGSPWPGRVLRAVAPTQTKIAVLQRLREETGLTVSQIVEQSRADKDTGDGLFTSAVVIFLAVNHAGYTMTLAEVQQTFSLEDVEPLDDAPVQDPGTDEVPPRAPTGSAPAAVEGTPRPPASRAKRAKSSTKR